MNRWLLIFFMLATGAHASLLSSRNHEISRLSLCPLQPSVLILEGPMTDQISTYLREFSNFNRHYQLVERPQLGESRPACREEPQPENTVYLDDYFAMYFLSLEYDPKSPAPQSLHLQIMRTDTGAIIYDKKAAIGGEFPTVMSFMQKVTPLFIAILDKQRNECLNQFTATVTEDVDLRCQGKLASETDYVVQSDFRLMFTIRSFDFSIRDKVQNLGGSMSIQPRPAKIIQKLSLQKKGADCDFSVSSEKILNINLQDRELPAIFHLTIPSHLGHPWLFEPNVTSADPFFMGDGLEENVVTTTGSEQCPNKNSVKKETTQMTFSDHNLFKFSRQEFNPFCGASNFVQPVFTRAPNLGISAENDITSGCTRSSLNASVTFKRRFYKYGKR